MKSIMISIQPQWVEKILNGEKTIEIRKTMPKCELPCKVYIYCTKGKKLYKCVSNFDEDLLNGKVVAEFTLNKVDILERDLNDWLPKNRYDVSNDLLKNINLNQEQLWNYGQGKTLYAWYIDDLKVYDKPKYLSEFKISKCKEKDIHIRKLEEENKQLKQSQKHLAIEQLEKVEEILWNSQDIGNVIDNDKFLEKLNYLIKSLKGEE